MDHHSTTGTRDFTTIPVDGTPQGFSFSFTSSQPPRKVFETLADIRSWWSGLYGEQFESSAESPGDAFTFSAGNGAHYSKQKLIDLVPEGRIAWLVTESRLSFLQQPDEWTGTTFGFRLSQQDVYTRVDFRHAGLVPAIECYNGCAGAWTQYLERLAARLK